MKFFDPESRFILQWNKSFLLCSVIALSLDPLFFYIPIVDGTNKCLDVDRNKLEIAVCVLRSLADMLYVVHIIIQFRTAYVPHYNPILGQRVLIDEPHYVARRYLKSYFITDVLAALSLPQFAVLVIIPSLDGPTSLLTENLLKFIIFFQYIPRVIRISLFYQEVTKISGFLTEKAWAGAGFNFFLYVLASHVVGAIWYLFAIESELRCWHIACQRHNCRSKFLYCGEGRVGDYGILNTSCPLLERIEIKNSTNFDFGIYLDALQTRIVETRDFRQKILYCSWWGLQSLSSLGQGLKASTFYGEILFADFIAVIGLVLFALLIGNMQGSKCKTFYWVDPELPSVYYKQEVFKLLQKVNLHQTKIGDDKCRMREMERVFDFQKSTLEKQVLALQIQLKESKASVGFYRKLVIMCVIVVSMFVFKL